MNNNLIIVVLIFFSSFSNSLLNLKNINYFLRKKSNKFYNKNFFMLTYNNLIIKDEINLFGFNDFTKKKKFYFIIGEPNNNLILLLEDLENTNHYGIYVPTQLYKTKDLDVISETIIKKSNISKPYNNTVWIFDRVKYIGGLFDIYSIIYNN
jgi:hypothetical protein